MSNNLSSSSTTLLHPARMKSSTRFIHPDQFDDAPEENQLNSCNTHGIIVANDNPQQVVAARRISDILPKFNQAERSMSPSASILPSSAMMTAAITDPALSTTQQQRVLPTAPCSTLFRTTPTLEQFHLKSSATRRMLAATRPNIRFNNNSHQVDVVDGYNNVSPATSVTAPPLFVPQRISTNENDPPFFCPTPTTQHNTTTTSSSNRTVPHSVSPNHCHTPAAGVVHAPVISTTYSTATTAAENKRLSQQELYLSASPDNAKSEDIIATVKSPQVVSAASKRIYEQACLPYNSNASHSVQSSSNDKAIIFTLPSKKKKKKKVVHEKKYDKKWSEKYAELVAFHKAKGHCRVPQKYPNNPTLGIWVHNQRRKYKLGVMSFERVGLLNQIDFQWEITRGGERTDYPLSPMRRWESMFSELCAFKQKHGHFNVKLNTRLGDWVEAQRYWHDRLLAGDSSAKITKERVELLKCVGVSLTTN